jgi:glyoxylase-like metal-dependent hydrolase (beta-lactamase superfamily II)
MFNQYYNGFKEYGEGCEVEVLPDTFETEKGVITVIHTPGHTGGSCCFYVDDVLYTGDTLLPTISTNPSIHAVFDSTCGLKNYQKSLKELLPLRVTKCFPGHGGVINDHKKRIQQIFKGHNQRREIVMNSLSERPQSLIEVTEKVFGKVPATETLLALAECFDHLNMLKEEGIVEILERDLYFFKKV